MTDLLDPGTNLPPGFTPHAEGTEKEWFPQGYKPLEGEGTALREFANSQGVTDGKVLGAVAKHLRDFTSKAQTAGFQKAQEEWKERVTKDSLNTDEALASQRKVLEAHGSEALTKLLKDTGFQNHPAIRTFLASVAKAIPADPNPIPGTQPAGNTEADIAERMYGGLI